MRRDDMLARLKSADDPFDILVIGGGATGVGTALDAAARGYRVALVEQKDLGQGTSSRSTKLVHGGVRYLQQGNISLVMEALHERGRLRQNAPHLVHDLAFVVPNYEWWEAPFYGIGMKVYDVLAGRYGFGRSHGLSKEDVLEKIPTIEQDGLRGGVVYHDGQFDDSRLLVHLARTAATKGAVIATYTRVEEILDDEDGMVAGVRVRDEEAAETFDVFARAIVNATGPFADEVRRLDDPAARPMIRPSQGVHIVLDGSFLPGGAAIMVPRTEDKRVLFAIPWHGRTVVGTTDTPIDAPCLEPRAQDDEIDFLLRTAAQYLERDPKPEDVLSVFVGIRPLVGDMDEVGTSEISRDHTIHVSKTGLLTIAGGKWTTYRKMAEDVVDQAAVLAGLPHRPCVTEDLKIHGWTEEGASLGDLEVYGTDAREIHVLVEGEPELGQKLHPRLTTIQAEVVWAARSEMARKLEDVLARRTRALFLDARAAVEAAPRAAALLARETERDDAWAAEEVRGFEALARQYILPSEAPTSDVPA